MFPYILLKPQRLVNPKPRDDIDACVAAAQKDPDHLIVTRVGKSYTLAEVVLACVCVGGLMIQLRKHPYKKGVLRYYCEKRMRGHKKSLGCLTGTCANFILNVCA